MFQLLGFCAVERHDFLLGGVLRSYQITIKPKMYMFFPGLTQQPGLLLQILLQKDPRSHALGLPSFA